MHSCSRAFGLSGRNRSFIRFALAPAALLASSIPASAADAPESGSSPQAADESLVPVLPDFPWIWSEQGPLELRLAAPFAAGDKGGAYTDMGVPGSGRLTERERALLELSRAAVAASRLAGTLGATNAAPTIETTRAKEEKLARSSAVTPVPGTGAPSDHVNPNGVPAVPSGPVALTPSELEKLAAALGQPGIVVLPPSSAPMEAAGAPQRPEPAADATKTTATPAKGK